MIRYETKDNIDFIIDEKLFENENPIIAREEAFSHVLLSQESLVERVFGPIVKCVNANAI